MMVAIMEIDQIVEDLERRLSEAEEVAAEIPGLRAQLDAAHLMQERYGKGRRTSNGQQSFSEAEWQALSRRQAINRLLAEAGQAMSPAEISRRLVELGRSRDQPNPISATLAEMKKRGEATQISFGKWVLVHQSTALRRQPRTLPEGVRS